MKSAIAANKSCCVIHSYAVMKVVFRVGRTMIIEPLHRPVPKPEWNYSTHGQEKSEKSVPSEIDLVLKAAPMIEKENI